MNDEELREKERNSKWFKKLSKFFKEDDVFWNNEIQANIFVSFCLLLLIIILILSWVLTYFGIFDVPLSQMSQVFLFNVPLLLTGIILTNVFKGQKPWLKYVLIIISITTSIALCSVISIFVGLITCIPVVLSCRYYSRKFTNTSFSLTVVGMAISEILYAHGGLLDLNLMPAQKGTIIIETGLRDAILDRGYDGTQYLINLFRGSFAPRFLLLCLIAFICQELARRAHEMVLSQAEISQKTESVKAELGMAHSIQGSMLPTIFPAFPTRPDLDIKASMNPAKEVGGDFYDFTLLDDDHLLIVMADVSGKGVPAALFMMVSKILISTHAKMNYSPAAIAAAVNEQLCTNNEVEMFVTAWIGVLEISTGVMSAVDAGHEYPIVKHGDGEYELIKGKKSFVLAGMEGVPYKEYSFDFKRGDKLFLYTDGVTEATNARDELFGMDRLLTTLNQNGEAEPEELLPIVLDTIKDFVREAPQFDDITMLSMHFQEEKQ